jgi:hypothetical protein
MWEKLKKIHKKLKEISDFEYYDADESNNLK